MQLSGWVAILNVAGNAVTEARDLGPQPINVKAGRVMPLVDDAPPLADGETFGAASYEIRENDVLRTWAVEPAPRRLIAKSIVLSRLTDEQLNAALGLMNNRQKERWRAPDKAEVFVDDTELLAVLNAVGADAAFVLAE